MLKRREEKETVPLRDALPIVFLACLLGIPTAWAVHAAPRPSDETISIWVREALLGDPRTEASNITVNTNDGLVTLTGSARNLGVKLYADLEAKKITGVRGVVNDLSVTPSFHFDTDLASDIRKRLITSASITADGLRVTVHQGIVTLAGTVSSWAERQETGLLAGEAGGVKDVINNLVVQYSHTRPDAEIQHDVAAPFARDVYLTGLPITASVKGGEVTLEGEVGSAYQKERAGNKAHLIWNVVGVTNNLKVVWWESMGTRQKSPAPTDAQLVVAVRAALAEDQRLDASNVTVRVRNREVTLQGLVPFYYQKRLAAQAAQDVVGVMRVINGLAVQTAQRGDVDLQSDVQQQLDTDAFLAPGRLGVRCHDGIVTLTGDINNAFEKTRATDAASRVTGVRNIVNNMTVSSDWDTDAAIAWRIKDFMASLR